MRKAIFIDEDSYNTINPASNKKTIIRTNTDYSNHTNRTLEKRKQMSSNPENLKIFRDF